MIYKHKTQIPAKTKETDYYVASCIKCDGDEIKLEEYEDNYGYISTATCKKCGQTMRRDGMQIPKLIDSWNANNDIITLIRYKTQLIATTKLEIKDLEAKLKQRNKKKKHDVATDI